MSEIINTFSTLNSQLHTLLPIGVAVFGAVSLFFMMVPHTFFEGQSSLGKSGLMTCVIVYAVFNLFF